MELPDQGMKAEMEQCKRRARAAGLQFPDDTLEYLLTNQDLLELSPKVMIPSLYDYWMNDLEVVRNKWVYDAFPHNPYETVINTRPPISFYNNDNADWFNVMIFYHVLGHIDFLRNNIFFRKTWDDDFYGQALADKRLINRIRDELGVEKRWVDYVIEFSRAIDNLVGFHLELQETYRQETPAVFGGSSPEIDFYFRQFLARLRDEKVVELNFYYDEIKRYNQCLAEFGKEQGEAAFLQDNSLRSRFPEFNAMFKKWKEREHKPQPKDIFQYLMEHSEFLNKEKNMWMQDVMQVIRRTSLYFQPQIRSKICNEGWASLWHERLYITDDRIKTHEVDYAKVDSGVTSDPKIGLNPYAIGKHLYEFIEDMARKGRLSSQYHLLKGIEDRRHYDRHLGEEHGKVALFGAREYLDDYLLINFLSDEDFQDFIDKYKLVVLGARLNLDHFGMADVYIKSKSGKEYRKLLNKELYHPPNILINEEKAKDGELYLEHVYEGRTLISQYIPSVLIGLEFFWGKRVKFETTEYQQTETWPWWYILYGQESQYKKIRVLYTCEGRRVKREVLQAQGLQVPGIFFGF